MITRTLFKLARLSATMRAASRGPGALGKRLIRIGVGRTIARTGVHRWPQ